MHLFLQSKTQPSRSENIFLLKLQMASKSLLKTNPGLNTVAHQPKTTRISHPPLFPGHPPPHPQPRIELHIPRAPRSMYQSSCTSEDRPWLTHYASNALSFIKITCYTAKGTGVFYARPMRDLCSNVALMQAVCKQTFESREIY